ncbi:dihydroxyacetone kinase subunit L [Lutibacter sp. B2]|nr:dihydroxyacetone kinase subunit L [Lutibacter sp. B2]
MVLTIVDWKKMLLSVSNLLKENAEQLSQLDSVMGDGDHGITINKIAGTIQNDVEQWKDDTTLKDFLENLGWNIMGVNGGSAGPLWGNLFIGFSDGMNDEIEVDEILFKKMFIFGLDEIYEITSARIGDKTMMDALIPAVQSMKNSNSSITKMLEDAYNAAKDGEENTINMIAKFGRAKNLKERSLGYKDPGAVSISLLFEGMAKGLYK